MDNFRRRKSFPGSDNMDDLRPLMLDPAEVEPDLHAVECAPEESPLYHSCSSEQHALQLQQDKRAFRNVLNLGISFMLIFTAFNTNGIMTVSKRASTVCNIGMHRLSSVCMLLVRMHLSLCVFGCCCARFLGITQGDYLVLLPLWNLL